MINLITKLTKLYIEINFIFLKFEMVKILFQMWK